MFGKIACGILFGLLFSGSAMAQASTAQQVLPGFLTTVGCPGSAWSCYVSGVPATATAAVASSIVLKAAPGNLYSLQATVGATAGFIMVFNAITAPSDGTVTPALCYPIAANTGVNLPLPPVSFSVGITAVFSSTGCFTKTASATAFISGGVL